MSRAFSVCRVRGKGRCGQVGSRQETIRGVMEIELVESCTGRERNGRVSVREGLVVVE